MFPLNFNKKRAEYYLQCLGEGKPIEPEQTAWTVNEMVGLAGACFFGLLSHGPLLRKAAADMQGKKLEPSEATEHQEADDELVFNDLRGAIEFVGYLTMLVNDQEYDDNYEKLVRCGVTQEGQVTRKVGPIEGYKSV